MRFYGAQWFKLCTYLTCSCTDGTVASRQECIGTFVDDTSTVVEREWLNSSVNFDNILQAFVALFVTMSLDGMFYRLLASIPSSLHAAGRINCIHILFAGYADLMTRTMSIPAEPNLQPKVCLCR